MSNLEQRHLNKKIIERDFFFWNGWKSENSGGNPPQIIHFFIGFSMIFTIHFGGKIPLFLETPKWLRISPARFCFFFPGEISGPTAAVLEGSVFFWTVWIGISWFQEMDFLQQPAEINWKVSIKKHIHEISSHVFPISKPSSVWSNYSDLTRPHPNLWFSKGIPLLSGTSRLVKYHNLAIIRSTICNHLQWSQPHLGNPRATWRPCRTRRGVGNCRLLESRVSLQNMFCFNDIIFPKTMNKMSVYIWLLILDAWFSSVISTKVESNTLTDFHFEFFSFVVAKELDDREEEAAENDMEEKSEHLTLGSTNL